MPTGNSSDDKIKYFKNRGKLLAEKERHLSKIKNLAKRNPDMGVDPVAIEEKIAACRALKKSCYDEVGDLRKAERERKKTEREDTKLKTEVIK